MLTGLELFVGVKKEKGFNHTIVCGLGGVFIEIIQRVSALVEVAPEIVGMDMNPLIGTKKEIKAVDVRIRIEKDF
ncbi:MAG: acetate--CoA ligase family protein [Flavobacteriaceae bacterium]|nr:acetate--CoA ligase family protein [Flavobacteriaceae bacterium]